MPSIGIVPMSGKPYHAGHDGLVRLAASENDEVHVYVSTSDRENVSGQAMQSVWHDIIEPSLPANVAVTYGGSPVANAYKELGQADQAGSTDTFRLYSDPQDIDANFPDRNLEKYSAGLHAAGRIIKRPVERTSTVDTSGTKMRGYLASGDEEAFLRNMPASIDGKAVWRILLASQPAAPKERPKSRRRAESVLRGPVRHVQQR